MSKADTILKHILGSGQKTDRREYDVEDLMGAYGINKTEAKKLYKKLHK